MRPVVALDAALLAIPNSASTESEAEAILGRVIDWSACLETDSAIQIAQLSDTADILADVNVLPNSKEIDGLLSMFALKHVYTAEDIRRSIDRVLERAPFIRDLLGAEAKHVSFCQATPSVLVHYDTSLRPVGERVLSSAVCASVVRFQDMNDVLFVALGTRISAATSVQICCVIDTLDLNPKLENLYAPVGASGTVKLAWSPQDVALRLSPAALWNRAENCRDLHLAIMLEAFSIMRTMSPDTSLNMIPTFHIGSEFYASVFRNGAGPGGVLADTVRETCARLILGNSKYAIKPLLKAGKKKKRSDGAFAFRTHVTKHHAGIRLMFWANPGHAVELANIGPIESCGR